MPPMLWGAPRIVPRTVRLLVLAGLVLMVSSCAAGPPPQPSAPPGTSKGYLGEALATRADLTMGDLHSRLRQHYEPPWDIDRYTVSAATTWESIMAHYAAALGPDWEVDARYPEGGDTSSAGYRSRVWSDGDRAVAIALNTGDVGDEQVLTVLVPDDDR